MIILDNNITYIYKIKGPIAFPIIFLFWIYICFLCLIKPEKRWRYPSKIIRKNWLLRDRSPSCVNPH